MSKFEVILVGELCDVESSRDKVTVVADNDDDIEFRELMLAACRDWILNDGDTIHIKKIGD